MGCCTSTLNLKTSKLDSLDDSVYMDHQRGSSKRSYSSRQTISSGLGSACSTPSSSRDRSIWSRRSSSPAVTSNHSVLINNGQPNVRPICDDFAEQPLELQERSQGYYTCSSSASTPTKSQLIRTQDMNSSTSCASEAASESSSASQTDSSPSSPVIGNLEWEMYMMQHAQRIMPKTSSPICQRRCDNDKTFELPTRSKSYHKWRNYLQTTPAHMLHNVTNIPEAIAGHFCPTDFPAFSDLEDMESAAKRYKVDATALYTTSQLLAGHTQTITTDL
ncbi:uncharacterized protein [Drosophila tropicalis]|uniref:uncharacterized protein n=1 Tax=Drosophila tropicalis TaxID=46794 RepID=UPI0035AB7AB6